ncbi:MAG: hypothetical protein Q8R07_00550 [Candidatus Uhrbacteria bacterium]|nr:hypothetical protein [Candidatus Uhrbacteria bacterium]
MKIAIVSVVAVIAVAVMVIMALSSSRGSRGPELNRVYQVMLYQEDVDIQVNGGGKQRVRLVGVHFVGKDHSNRPPQYVPPDFVKKVNTLQPGTGKWVIMVHPNVEGIDYGWHTEFQYNGELGEQPRVPTGGTPRS